MIPFGERFEELQARQMFGLNKLEVPWMVGEPMEAGKYECAKKVFQIQYIQVSKQQRQMRARH